MAENPMMAKMLASMIGMQPEELARIATTFGEIGKYAYEGLQRIERKQDLILDMLNVDRERNGFAVIKFERIPERGGSGGGGGIGPG